MKKNSFFLKQNTLADLFLIIFVLVDDYLKALEQAGICELPKAENQKASYRGCLKNLKS